MTKELITFYNRIIKRVSYWLPLIIFLLIGYGFSAFNPTVGIDDLSRDIYIGNGNAMFSATRWGMNLWTAMLSTTTYIPGIDHIIGVLLMFCASIMFSFLLYTLSVNKQYSLKYTVFSSLFITYPIIAEIWEYNGANFMVAGNFIIVSFALVYMEYHKHLDIKTILICGFPLSLVASSYETGIFVYITSVLLILFYKYCIQNKKQNKYEWFFEGLSYVPALIVSILIRIIIGISIIKLIGLTYKVNGSASIGVDILGFISNAILYIFNTVIYFPITIFIIVLILFFIYALTLAIKRKNIMPIILFLLISISLFSQALLTIDVMAYRTAHTLIIFISFVGYFFVELVEINFDRKVYGVIVCVLMFLSYRQAVYLDSILTLNHVRSENEMRIVSEIGYSLKSQYEEKPIIFVGTYSLGNYIEENALVGKEKWNHKLYRIIRNFKNPDEVYRIYQSTVKSNLNWSVDAFGNQELMKLYFSYCGFEIELVDGFNDELYNESISKAKQYQMKPFEIVDDGDYILVCLGSLE